MGSQVDNPPALVQAPINYFLELNEGGTEIIYPGTATDKLRPLKQVVMPIKNVRACDEQFTLDTHGFQFVSHQTAEKTYDDVERIRSAVYDETANLMKKM